MIVCLFKFVDIFNLAYFRAIQTFLDHFNRTEADYHITTLGCANLPNILGDVTHGRVLRQKLYICTVVHGSKKIRVRAMVSRPSWREKF